MRRITRFAGAAGLVITPLLAAASTPAHAIGTICNPSPKPSITISDDFVYEHQTADLLVNLSNSSCSTVKVNYETVPVSAQAGVDYVTKSGVLTFSPGQTSKSVFVDIVDDALYEANETFWVKLSGPSNATIADSIGKVTISGLEPAG